MDGEPLTEETRQPLLGVVVAEVPGTKVFGGTHADPAVAAKIKKVLIVSFVIGMSALLMGIMEIIVVFKYGHGSLLRAVAPGVFQILLGLLIPLCGYQGAKTKTRWAVGCFCCCNWVGFFMGFVSLAVLILIILVKVAGVRVGNLGRDVGGSLYYVPTWYFYLSSAVCLVDLVLAVLAAIWGCSLYYSPAMFPPVVVDIQPPAISTQKAAVQDAAKDAVSAV